MKIFAIKDSVKKYSKAINSNAINSNAINSLAPNKMQVSKPRLKDAQFNNNSNRLAALILSGISE